MYGTGDDGFQSYAAFQALGNFAYIFICSFLIGSGTGCLTAAISFSIQVLLEPIFVCQVVFYIL